MADPITVGGGGGLFKTLANYPIDLNFDDRIYMPDGHGNYLKAASKISLLEIREYGGALLADLTRLLPANRECTLVFRFNHFEERINIDGNPFKISFEDELWPKARGKRSRQTRKDRLEIDFKRGPWGGLELMTPRLGFLIVVESEPV